MFGLDVEVPVRREVVVTDDGAEDEEGLGARDAPSAAGNVESVGEVAGCAFDDAAGDRPAGGECPVVVDEVGVAVEVLTGFVGGRALITRQLAVVGLGADLVGGLLGVSAEDAGCLDGDPALGVRIGGGVEAAGGGPLGRPRGEVPVAGSFSARPPTEPRGQLGRPPARCL
ncbi:hypothetical protein [Streptomyces luteireticuli]|uniref:hypothetical protein n=1 Tax=Streptomyces luteireticuli TaxID=173858 RepID=UPI003556C43B